MEFKNLAEVTQLEEVPEGASVLAATAEGEVVRVPGEGLGGGGGGNVLTIRVDYESGIQSYSPEFDVIAGWYFGDGIDGAGMVANMGRGGFSFLRVLQVQALDATDYPVTDSSTPIDSFTAFVDMGGTEPIQLWLMKDGSVADASPY